MFLHAVMFMFMDVRRYVYVMFLDVNECIWLIFTRTVTPLEIFRWFPQIVFTLLTFVRPINVGFSNRFFVYQIKGV